MSELAMKLNAALERTALLQKTVDELRAKPNAHTHEFCVTACGTGPAHTPDYSLAEKREINTRAWVPMSFSADSGDMNGDNAGVWILWALEKEAKPATAESDGECAEAADIDRFMRRAEKAEDERYKLRGEMATLRGERMVQNAGSADVLVDGSRREPELLLKAYAAWRAVVECHEGVPITASAQQEAEAELLSCLCALTLRDPRPLLRLVGAMERVESAAIESAFQALPDWTRARDVR